MIPIKIVIFDGASGSGKTTLRYNLFYEMNFNILTIDRFTPSLWVYDYLRGINRNSEIKNFESKFDLCFNPLLVMCDCDLEIAKSRVQDNKLRKRLFLINDEKNAFSKYLNEICNFSNFLKLDTNNSIEECISKILEKI